MTITKCDHCGKVIEGFSLKYNITIMRENANVGDCYEVCEKCRNEIANMMLTSYAKTLREVEDNG